MSAIENSQELTCVRYVEVDQIMRANACSAPVRVTSWGLNRICEQDAVTLDDFYTAPTTGGKGVTAYIVDTGIYVNNVDFSSRASFGFKANSLWSDTDGNGHGTHVASTVIGRAYGVAREATAIAVKVLGDDGSGTNAGVIAGVDWVAGRGTPRSVINMSLGGGFSSTLNAAVNNAVAKGVVTVVAAGNDNRDACNYSPASASAVISTGSTEDGSDNSDVRSYFSNYGTCVNIFAPGSAITAAWIGSPSATRTISGTSMASPHVAGIGALLRADFPNESATQIQKRITDMGTKDVINLVCAGVSACSASPNLMAWNGCTLSK